MALLVMRDNSVFRKYRGIGFDIVVSAMEQSILNVIKNYVRLLGCSHYCDDVCRKVKVSVDLYSALSWTLRRSGMARVLKGSHNFTCTPRVYPLTEWTIPAFAVRSRVGHPGAVEANCLHFEGELCGIRGGIFQSFLFLVYQEFCEQLSL